ncbi:FAD-binding-3 domain-containing protein [Mycena venus]|uniref:FAD-binding-3 domain-containing protein n=1 Tax=Mycena venus TaxID=2733690 RepID=A0A8H6XPY3_9AGAR|nr:FAD-binding-3 domain-containing protein [Mycena venus]
MSDLDSGLKFIIVGASVSGLSSAIALKSAGHSVLVLEKDAQLGGIGSIPNGFGCARIPPNGCKILLDWGLEAEVKANSAPVSGFAAYKYAEGQGSSPDHLGVNRYDPEMLSEARGGYVQFLHRDLIRILHDLALKPSHHLEEIEQGSGPQVFVLFGAEVVNVDCKACSVTLRSGEIHTGDAIIGADGANGIVRRTLLKEEDASLESDTLTGIAAYSAIVPNALVFENDLALFCSYLGCTVWAGPNRGLTTFNVGKDNDISLLLYTPDNSQDGTWTENAEKKITDVLGSCDEHIRKIAALAGPSTCLQIKQPCELESWISESGRVLVLGDAAHPFPPGSAQNYAVALEDGTFIGKIFSHTRNSQRVPEFLRAFQEHRELRCTRIRQMEREYIYYITLPDGEMQVGRDTSMRARHAAGQNVFDGDLQQMQEDIRMVFGYEAPDDADEWWMSWGRYRDVSEASPGPCDAVFSVIFSSSTARVDDEVAGLETESGDDGIR